MFTTFGSRLVQGGCRRSARATFVRGNAVPANNYSSDVKAELNEDAKTLRDAFNHTVKPLPVRDQLKNESEAFLKDYKPVYNYFTNPKTSVRSELPAEFYDKTPRQQEAYLAFLNAQRSTYGPLLDAHGENLSPGFARASALMDRVTPTKKTPIKVCFTGASGQLGYALVFRIASGAMFGPNTPVILSLLELPNALPALQGVVMELRDCAFPLVHDIIATDKAEKAFSGVDYALLVGARPRSKGMERGDLLMANAEIFSTQGKALNNCAKGNKTRVLVVGNPANTNAMIAAHHAPTIPKENFSAMTRLDHNRGLAQLSQKLKCKIEDIDRFVIWGNHSATQYPDITHAKIGDKWAVDILKDQAWLEKDFYPTVQKRGAAILEQRGLSSAASAASSAVDAIVDWHFGTNGKWTSAAVCSNGEYGVTPGLFYSYPVVYNSNQERDIVRDLPITPASAALMEATHQELLAERDAVAALLK